MITEDAENMSTTINPTFQKKLECFEELFHTSTTNGIDDITIGKQLGRGGFGTVCECFVTNKKFALKRFHVQSRNKKAAEESFLSEKIALQLQHKHIVQTFRTFTRDDTHFILMEFVSARTLQSVIDNDTEVLSYTRRIQFARQIVSGLEYAHLRNIVHLDLKPANILLNATTDHCKIADFGCCKILSEEDTQATTPTKSNLTGTYSYRAPELFRGEPPTVKADIYSFGICLWQMLARQQPYENQNHQVVIFNVVAYQLRPTIPEDLQGVETSYTDLMSRCWHQTKEQRPEASEILQSLLD